MEWGARFQKQVQATWPDAVCQDHGSHDRQPDRPLVVGYVSCDLFTHSVSYFAEAPLTHHSPSRQDTP